MFEEIVESRFRSLKSISESLKSFSIEDIKKSDLPVYAVNFIIAEQTDINDKNTLNALLEKSVKLIVNYSLRPKWTLVNYLFGSYDSKPAEEILKKIEVFGFYRYYVDLISNNIKDNSLMFITQDEVNDLINEANRVVLDKLVKDTSSIKIKNFFSQVYKLKYGDDREINLDWSIPFLFIKLFLEDKDFQEITEKFKIIPGLDDSMEIEMKTAIKILTDKYYVNNDFFVIKDEAQTKKTETPVKEIQKETEEAKKQSPETPGTIDLTEELKEEKPDEIPVPLPVPEKSKIVLEEEKPKGIIRIIKNIPAKRFHREKKVVHEAPKEEKEEIIISEPKEEEIKTGERHKTRKRDGDETGNFRIKHLFKQEELNTITKKIFKDSKSSMQDAFDELERMESWSEASEYLKEIFIKNKVDFYNKQVVLFIDLLQDHFLLTEKGK